MQPQPKFWKDIHPWGWGTDITPAAVICCHKYCQDERVAMERSGNTWGLGSELDI